MDRYDDFAPQFARECLRELEERGVLVLNCSMDVSLSSCLHDASRALAWCVSELLFRMLARIMLPAALQPPPSSRRSYTECDAADTRSCRECEAALRFPRRLFVTL